MRELNIIYRSHSHVPFWIVAEKAGVWEKNGLKVTARPQLEREKAVEALKGGQIDLISGNHHNLYARKAKNQEDFVHLAQLGNLWTDNHMVVGDSIKTVADLRGKRVAIDHMDSHFGLNIWLFLRQEGLDFDRKEVDLVEERSSTEARWQGVLRGDYDATFIGAVHALRARKAGGKIIPVRAMPMIRGVTLTTTMSYVKRNEEDIRRLMRGLVQGIHFFLTQKDKTKEILAGSSEIRLQNEEEVETLHAGWVENLDRKPYPTPAAIANVFALAVRLVPEIADFNPLALWDTHYVKELDDSGFIDELYKQ
jgi:ABC-type nitrate/sulfonate/bicarbonate transport system substrate-binding protein